MLKDEILWLKGHDKDLGGGFVVRRILPAAERRSVGYFVFFDHFGPVTVHPADRHDVRPHPHIGLATVSYFFEGAIFHRDSLGYEQEVTPGAINWMTAGRGIVHSERRPERLADSEYVNHGLQLWAALPKEHEEAEPQFVHTPAEAIPQLQLGGATVRVLIGEAFGAVSPVKTLAPMVYLDMLLPPGASLTLPPGLGAELALYGVQGPIALRAEGAPAEQAAVLEPHRMAVLPDRLNVPLQLHSAGDQPARCVLIGGEPMDGPRHMWWNFVSSRPERIAQAAADWEAQGMGKVPGETEFIPAPPLNLKPQA